MRPSETDETIELPHWGMELLKRDSRCKLEDVEIDLIWDFAGHPFPVREGRDMDELVESIRKMGQLEPALIRKLPDGSYEMLSGHRRKMALSLLGQDTIRAIVLPEMNDRQAEAIMLECNTRRDELLPSEKGRVYYEKKRLYQQMTAAERGGGTGPFRHRQSGSCQRLCRHGQCGQRRPGQEIHPALYLRHRARAGAGGSRGNEPAHGGRADVPERRGAERRCPRCLGTRPASR